MWELLIQQCPLVDDYRGGSSAILEGDQWVSVSRRAGRSLGLVGPFLQLCLLLCNGTPACR